MGAIPQARSLGKRDSPLANSRSSGDHFGRREKHMMQMKASSPRDEQHYSKVEEQLGFSGGPEGKNLPSL